MKVLHRGGLFQTSLMTLMPLMHLVMMRLLVIPRKSNDAVNLITVSQPLPISGWKAEMWGPPVGSGRAES